MKREGKEPIRQADAMPEPNERNERKRRHSQNNHLLREIMERLREYEPEEVVIICNKFRQRRGLPPLDPKFLDTLVPGK